jgi:hypothetical protein
MMPVAGDVGHVTSALRFWRDETRYWWPRWLFVTDSEGVDRVVGLGFQGLLLIWRAP